MARPDPSSRPPAALVAGFGIFFLAIVFVMTAAVLRRRVPEFPATPPTSRATPGSLTVDTVTVDASDGDRWRFFDLATRSILVPPDTAGWDLAFRRFGIIAADGVADLGPVPFPDMRDAPAGPYEGPRFAADTVHPVLERWYTYSFLSHLLTPKPHVYVVQSRDGHVAKVEFLSYYCVGTRAGCITFVYAYQGDGTRRFD